MRTPLVQLQADLLAKHLQKYLEKHPEAEEKRSVQALRKAAGLPDKGPRPAPKRWK